MAFRLTHLVACCTLVALACGAGRPVWGATYTFTGGSFAPTAVSPNITASSMGIGAGLTGGSPTFVGASAHGVPSDGILIRTNGTPTTMANALTGNDYLLFTFTPDAGLLLNFNSLSFDMAASNNNNPTGPVLTTNVAVRSSLDAFATTLDTFVLTETDPDSGPPLPAGRWSNYSLDLSGIDFQNVPVGTEFRLYIFDNENQAGDVTRLDNIVFDVTAVAIPEPASLGLFGVMAAVLLPSGWLARRRRIQQS